MCRKEFALTRSQTIAAFLLLGSFFGVGLFSGCGWKTKAKTEADADLSAGDVLNRMVIAYRDTEAYRDEAEVRIEYSINEEAFSDQLPLRVRFERPNRLYLFAYNSLVVCDGETMREMVVDPASNNLDQQMVVRPAPSEFIHDKLGFDPLIDDSFKQGPVSYPVQLELLLAESPLAQAITSGYKQNMLDEISIARHPCYQIEIETPKGVYLFAIDKKNFLLRRLKYPSAAMLPELANTPGVSGIEVVAEFHAAQFAVSEGSFKSPETESKQPVTHLMVPPPPVPTELLGAKPSAFSFVDLDGKEVKSSSWEDQTTVMVWFNDHPASQEMLRQLDAVRKRLAGVKDVNIIGVCAESSAMSDEAVASLVEGWKVDVPILRDVGVNGAQPAGQAIFEITGWPALVVLDRHGKMQAHHIGVDPLLEQNLLPALEQIRNGVDIAARQRNISQEQQAAYRQHLSLEKATDDVPQDLVPVPTLQAPKRQDPENYTLKEVWSNKDVVSPGALAVSGDHLFILDGLRTVLEIDAKGELIKRTVLPLPEGVAVNRLRVLEVDGKRYMAIHEVMGQTVYVVSDDKLLFAYPGEKEKSDGVREIALADLNANKEPELYVGFWGLVGVHQVDMQGKRTAGDRQVSSVLSLAVSTPNALDWRKLFVTSQDGTIVRYNQHLRADAPIQVRGRPIHHLFVPPDGSESDTPVYLGLSYLPGAQEIRVCGLGSDSNGERWTEEWGFEVPFSVRPPVVVAGGLLPGDGVQWAIATADGVMNVVSPDASTHEFFVYGEEVRDIAILEKQRLLVLSCPTGLRAVKFEKK